MAVESRVRAEGKHWCVDIRNTAKGIGWMSFKKFRNRTAAVDVASVMREE